jgi:predicted nucleotidyltransferase
VKKRQIPPNLQTLFRGAYKLSREEVIYNDIKVRKIPDQTQPAQDLIDCLLEKGYIERSTKHADDGYRRTVKGNALAQAKLVPRINRKKANELLDGVLERVAQINAQHDLLHWVTELRVFGSYLSEGDDLGDLDLAINMTPRAINRDCVEAGFELGRRHGKRFNNFLEKLYYPERLIKQIIKARSPYISIHEMSELDANPEWRGKTIYTFIPPNTVSAQPISVFPSRS